MKNLPPAIRDKTRYLRVRIHSEEEDIELGELVDSVWSSALDYMGSKGCSNTDFWVISNTFDLEKQEVIIRFRRGMEDDFRASLTQIDSFGGKKGFIEVKNISGSIKKLKNS